MKDCLTFSAFFCIVEVCCIYMWAGVTADTWLLCKQLQLLPSSFRNNCFHLWIWFKLL